MVCHAKDIDFYENFNVEKIIDSIELPSSESADVINEVTPNFTDSVGDEVQRALDSLNSEEDG